MLVRNLSTNLSAPSAREACWVPSRCDGRSLCLLLGILLTGCRPEGTDRRSAVTPVTEDGIGIVLVDSVLLRESDSLYIAHTSGFSIDPLDGSLYVADGYAMQAYRFARSGKAVGAYGRPGDGPGEIGDTRSAFAVGDSLIAVDDFRERTLELYDKRSGEFVGRRHHGGISGGQVLTSAGQDTIWMAFSDFPAGEFSVSIWIPQTDAIEHVWRVPEVYREHPGYFALSGLATSVARWRDQFLLGFGSLPHVYVVELDGERGAYRDSLLIPVRHRRPIAEDIATIADTRPETEKYASLSRLRHVFRRLDGSYLLIHEDPHLEGALPAVEIWADYYVGILTSDLTQACVDEPLDLGPRARALFASRGDTLFVLQREVVEGDGETEPTAATWVRAFVVKVDMDGCELLSTAIPDR